MVSLEKLDSYPVYPVTVVKYLLNLQKIKKIVSKIMDEKFDAPLFEIKREGCQECENSPRGCCRAHTCIERIFDPQLTHIYDVDNNIYLIKNEIYKVLKEENILLVFYCPHTKLIQQFSDRNIRKMEMFLFDVPDLKVVERKDNETHQFSSSELMKKPIVMWFNEHFELVTEPSNNGKINYHLRPIKK